jgi:hypothetical protein
MYCIALVTLIALAIVSANIISYTILVYRAATARIADQSTRNRPYGGDNGGRQSDLVRSRKRHCVPLYL